MNNLMRRSGIVAVLCLVLSLMLVITACGGDGAETTEAPETTAPEVTTGAPETTKEPDVTTAEPEAKVTYTVTVKDTDGNPIAGVKVQICEGEVCIPGTTGTDGVATIEAVEGVYQASVTKADGYTFDATAKVDLVDNAAVITLEKAPAPVVPADKITVTESIGDYEEPETLELKANGKVTYTYTAPTKGFIGIAIYEGATATITINNATTGKAGQTVVGEGYAIALTAAGSTYDIVVTSTEAATIEFAIEVYNTGDGSKENPFIIQNLVDATNLVPMSVEEEEEEDVLERLEYLLMLGMIPNNYYDNAVEVELTANNTVWYAMYTYMFAVNDPSVSVNYKGTLYPCDANGNRVFTVEERYEYDENDDLIGIYTDLYLNGVLIAEDIDLEEDMVFGFSAAADTTANVALRDGVVYPYWVDSFEGPFTIAPESGATYQIIPGSYEDGVYVVTIKDFDAEVAGYMAGRFGVVGSYTFTIDSEAEEYGDYASFYIINATEEYQVVRADEENVTALVRPVVEAGKTYTLADFEEGFALNNNTVTVCYVAPADGVVTLNNASEECECLAWAELTVDGYAYNNPITVEKGDVVTFIFQLNTNFFTGELMCDDCAFSLTFTAAPELELQ